jgi:hypothetical protein
MTPETTSSGGNASPASRSDAIHTFRQRLGDRVDLLYAILNCPGWIRSDRRWVVVRLEPLQQPARRAAQEQLCRKLTGLGPKFPVGSGCASRLGTRLFDPDPLSSCPKSRVVWRRFREV